MTEPHYVRFARAMALVGTLAAPGCGTATTPEGDTGATTNDSGTDAAAPIADAGDVDAFFDCTSCTCGLLAEDAGLPYCPSERIVQCGCAAVGPLAPPDLPALA